MLYYSFTKIESGFNHTVPDGNVSKSVKDLDFLTGSSHMWTICLVWRQLKRGPNIHHCINKQTTTQLFTSLLCRLCKLTLGKASWLSSSCKFLMILRTNVLQANGSHRIIERSLHKTERFSKFWKPIWIKAEMSSTPSPFFFYPSTCSCPFLTPSRNPCNSLARLPSTNFSRMQASKHQVNCCRATSEREKASFRKRRHLQRTTHSFNYL